MKVVEIEVALFHVRESDLDLLQPYCRWVTHHFPDSFHVSGAVLFSVPYREKAAIYMAAVGE